MYATQRKAAVMPCIHRTGLEVHCLPIKLRTTISFNRNDLVWITNVLRPIMPAGAVLAQHNPAFVVDLVLQSKRGDLNSDAAVNFEDLKKLLSNWLRHTPIASTCRCGDGQLL